ncbi:MAG: relaxase [Pseudomonadota bacterium]
MILKGSQRAGAAQLAAHLLNDRDNDHITLGELRGFVSSDLHGAFKEAQAVASGTRCKQHLFSLSLNPPIGAVVSEEAFKRAADDAEKVLGLDGQPRAIVFHEKEGRRHAHVVWSRIDAAEMRAINLPHFKTKLTSLSRDLYLNHGWELPEGLKPDGVRNPLNFSLSEWQQAKRQGLDPREIKQAFRDAWNRSDSQKGFENALAEYGYFLARGDRRGIVALDMDGNVYAVARYASLKTKQVNARITEADKLPDVSARAASLKSQASAQMREFIAQAKERHAKQLDPLVTRREVLTRQHRTERNRLRRSHEQRWQTETEQRAKRLRSGLGGLVDTLTGKARAIRTRNKLEAFDGLRRDQAQRNRLIFDQATERRALQSEFDHLRARQTQERRILARDVASALRRQNLNRSQHRSDQRTQRRRKRGPSLDRR